MKKFILIFSLIVSVNSYVLKAHQDLLLNQYYANIHYQVYFGYINEEINKVKLVSILCNKLSKELKFDDDINIYFEHEYIGFNKPHYTISTCSAGFESLDRCLNIFISEKKVDLEKILKLVEFGIKNYDYCADNQSLQEYQKVITYKRYSLDSNKRT